MKLIGLSIAMAGVIVSVSAAQAWGPNGWWKERAFYDITVLCVPVFMAGVGWEVSKIRFNASRRSECQAKGSPVQTEQPVEEPAVQSEAHSDEHLALEASAKPVQPA